MRHCILTQAGLIEPGVMLKIRRMDNRNGTDIHASDYDGKTGTVEYIDDAGQIHGSWGGCALIPDIDEFKIIE